MSGKEYAVLYSDMYSLYLSGGISTWDYDSVKDNSSKLNKALDKLKPGLDKVFQANVTNLGLPIVKYDTEVPDYIDGVLIESDPEKEALKKYHFLSYFNNRKSKVASASIEQFIPETSFEVSISVLVTERISRDDIQLLLMKMIDYIQESEDLNKLLY